MTREQARASAATMRRIADRLSELASAPVFDSDTRYRAAVMSDHALEIAADFDELERHCAPAQ